jgi:hypothetical protein
MSGFTGKTETIENVPGDVKGLRSGFADFLMKQGFEGLNTGTPDIAPFQKLFAQQNDLALAQAKESSGNLTGSGFANNLGKTAARGATEQGAFLSQLLEQSKQSNSNRLAQLLSSFTNTGVGSPETVYKPGFLDYATSLGGSVAGAAGSAGGFGKLF